MINYLLEPRLSLPCSADENYARKELGVTVSHGDKISS